MTAARGDTLPQVDREVPGDAGALAAGVPAYVVCFCLAIGAQFMSGSSDHYRLPLPPDRVLLLLALVLAALHPDARAVRWRLRPIHLAMVAALGWCLLSMIWFGGITDPVAVFAFADSFGVVPFTLFLLAPVVFGTAARRDALMLTLTVLGLYLGWISVAQGLHLYELVVPSSLVQPGHTHFDRAIGPSLQVASNGLALMGCAVAAAVTIARRTGPLRVVAIVALALCLAGAFFTLTRSIWLATLLGTAAVVLLERRLHRAALIGAAIGLVALAAAMAVPSISDAVLERAETSRSVYDRLNANEAAVRVVQARPLSGVGFGRFHVVESDWVWQSPTYPITTMGIDVHNVFLGYAAELGLPGLALWLVVVLFALDAVAGGPRSPQLRVYRLAALAYAIAWLTVAMLVPIKYAFPTSLLWVLLGIVASGARLGVSTRTEPSADLAARPAARPAP